MGLAATTGAAATGDVSDAPERLGGVAPGAFVQPATANDATNDATNDARTSGPAA